MEFQDAVVELYVARRRIVPLEAEVTALPARLAEGREENLGPAYGVG